MSIHKLAVIEDGAELGTNVTVGPFAVIHAGARIGDGCIIDSHGVVHGNVTMGVENRVHATAIIGDDPQDLGYKGETSFLEIGDHCIFREGVTIHRGTGEGTVTRIGNHCFLMACSHVAHNCTLEDHVIFVNHAVVGGHGHIGEHAFLGGYGGVHQFCRVGRNAMVGAGSVVTKDVPPFCTTRTTEYNRLSGLNTVGLRRSGFSPDERSAIKRAYHHLFLSQKSRAESVALCREKESAYPAALELCEFVESSKRGVCMPR